MMLKTVTRTSHTYTVNCKRSTDQWVFMCPDIHWDNPKCDRALLKKHFDEARALNARIIMPGDTFCLMQGLYDPRKQKGDIRPEHNVNHYLDAVIEDAARWFAPYQDLIDIVGLGNHETSVSKRNETDIVGRFVTLLNTYAKGDHRVAAGGYGGWYTLRFKRINTYGTYRIKYFHGSGGGAPVTKGTIQHNRQSTHVEGADCIVMGHVHNDYSVTYSREYLDGHDKPQVREVLMERCSTYKDDYDDGHSGWHVERGGGPRPKGGRFLCLHYRESGNNRPVITAWSRRAI